MKSKKLQTDYEKMWCQIVRPQILDELKVNKHFLYEKYQDEV